MSWGHGSILAEKETKKQGEEVASVLCVFLYIDTHRLPHTSEPLER